MMVFRVLKKVMLLVIPIGLVATLAWSLRTQTDFFHIRETPVDIEYQAHHRILLKELKPLLDKEIRALKGRNIWEVSLADLRSQWVQRPWIEDIRMSRRFPDKITTQILLRPVSFLYVDRKNAIYPVLNNGESLQKLAANRAPSLPILRNNNIYKKMDQLQKLIDLFEEIPGIGALKKENIASVDLQPGTGLTIELIKEEAVVHFGNKNISTKALQVLRVIDYLKSQKQKARVIDASFTKKVLVRPRKRS